MYECVHTSIATNCWNSVSISHFPLSVAVSPEFDVGDLVVAFLRTQTPVLD